MVLARATAVLQSAYRVGGSLSGYVLDLACPGQELGVMAWCAPQCYKPRLLAPDPGNVLSPFDCYLMVRARAKSVLKSAYRGGGISFRERFGVGLSRAGIRRMCVVRSAVLQTSPVSL